MNKVLVLVDCQNDFIDGALRNEEAIKKVPNIAKYINDFNGTVIFTKDTHDENYLNTLEGQKLPIKHCIKGTKGWSINELLMVTALANMNPNLAPLGLPFKVNKQCNREVYEYEKTTFGDLNQLPKNEDLKEADAIYLCGFCTDICVCSNALILRANYPNKKIVVLKNLCAGTSKEAHEAALTVMQSCQIDVE